MTTPNMGLTVPTPSVTLGPDWAEQISADLDLIDLHSHQDGSGVPIRTAALLIDDDLTFDDNSATDVRSVQLTDHADPLDAAGDLTCVYASDGDLFYNNELGQQVQITAGNALNAAALGGISGLPSGTASASFGAGKFSWKAATNQAAPMDVGPLLVRDTAVSANAVTVKSPAALAANIDVTLPPSLPGAASFVQMSATGALTSTIPVALGIDTANIANGAVTRAKQAAVGQQVSTACTSFSTSSTTYVDVTNLTVTIALTGRPCFMTLKSTDNLVGSVVTGTVGAGGDSHIEFLVEKAPDQDEIGIMKISPTLGEQVQVGGINAWFVGYTAGTYDVTVRAKVANAANSLDFGNVQLLVYEV